MMTMLQTPPDGVRSMSRITSEFLGTFLLCCFFLLGGRLGTALGLAALLWAFGPASGVTLNPLASIALFLRGRIGWVGCVGHLSAQLIAALAAAAFTAALAGHNLQRLQSEVPVVPDAWLSALTAEAIATAAYIFVFLVAFTSRRVAGSALAPFALGAVTFALHEAFNNFSAFMNPAVLLSWGVHDLVSALRAEEPTSALVGELARFGRFVPWALALCFMQLIATVGAWLAFKLTHPEDRRT
jgi:glycerol uptake facilitator-like aquaporin